MTLDDIEKGLIGFGGAVVAALVGLVRNGDIKRIEAIEDNQKAIMDSGEKGRESIRGEIHELREKVDHHHEQILNILLSRGGK